MYHHLFFSVYMSARFPPAICVVQQKYEIFNTGRADSDLFINARNRLKESTQALLKQIMSIDFRDVTLCCYDGVSLSLSCAE